MTTLIVTGALLGMTAGWVMHRADLCLVRPFRDLFLFGTIDRFRHLVLYGGVTMLLVEGCRVAGVISPYPFPLLTPPALTTIAGGIVFGFGMVLAGGCVVGTLYRLGSGQGTAFAALGGMIVGSGLYAEFHPVWKNLSSLTTLTPTITLPALLSVSPAMVTLPLGTACLIQSHRWWKAGRLSYQNRARGAVSHSTALLLLSVVTVVSWGVIGMPMGITTSYAKFAAFIERLVMPDHVAANPFFTARPFTWTNPLLSAPMTGGAGPAFDAIALIQFPLIGGIIAGASLSAVSLGEFKLSFRAPMNQYGCALAGGILMGLGARMTPGCNVWHLLGGVPILSLSSILFAFSLLPGAWIGSRILKRIILKG